MRWCRPFDYQDALDFDQIGKFEDPKIDAHWGQMRRDNDRQRAWHGSNERTLAARARRSA